MPRKNRPLQPRRDTAESDRDTASYEQLRGSRARASRNAKLQKMPHERDESARGTGSRLDQTVPPAGREIAQAHEDIEKGLVDTDRRGVPHDVPSSRDNRER